MHTFNKRPILHPKREVAVPEWLTFSSDENTLKTWRFYLKKYFYVEQQKTKTVLLTQVAAVTAIDNGLNGATRVIFSDSVRELEDGLIFFHLESAFKESYSTAMTQATIIVSIWEARFVAGVALDLDLSEQVKGWRDRIRAEKEFSEWLLNTDSSLFPEVLEVAKYAACVSKSMGDVLGNQAMLAEICKNNRPGPMAEFFGTDAATIGAVEIKRALWAKFEKVRSTLIQKYHARNSDRAVCYTHAMSKAIFLYTVLHPIQNKDRGRPSSPTLTPRAEYVASVRKQRRSRPNSQFQQKM